MERIYNIIEYLRGTCDSLDQACDVFECSFGDLSDEELEALDGEIFLCQECGWWSGLEDAADDGLCTDCTDCVDSEED